MANHPVRFTRIADLPALELYQTCDNAAFFPRHFHWVFAMTIVETGRRIHETKQGRHLLAPGHIVIVNAGDMHSTSAPDKSSSSAQSLRIDPALLSSLALQVSGEKHPQLYFKHPVIDDPELFTRIRQLYSTLIDFTSKLEKDCLLLDVFAELYTRHSAERMTPAILGQERTPVAQVCEYLQDCYKENVSLQQLSALANLSPFHLSRVFAKEIGIPPHMYQMQVRLKKATDLLAGGKSISAVAAETGFCDQSHFQRAFKKKFGITPGQYEW